MRKGKRSKNEQNSLGRRIESLRLELGLSMNELAKRVGISHVQISNYESDTQSPTSTILLKIAEHLGTTTDFLLNGSPTEELNAYFERIQTLPGAEQRKILEYLRERFEIESFRKLRTKLFGEVLEKDL